MTRGGCVFGVRDHPALHLSLQYEAICLETYGENLLYLPLR